ncbi:hypothetical protein [Neptuniibacter sp. QD37_11]|uniref:hypothetical protein n=1 Tax=Neptuniibacter sp. QD37_11 TaxID=3398209 RepID=UPI0039F5AEFB
MTFKTTCPCCRNYAIEKQHCNLCKGEGFVDQQNLSPTESELFDEATFHPPKKGNEAEPTSILSDETIPPEVLDLVRFLAKTWAETDVFVYTHCNAGALSEYPVIQGTKNQLNLMSIGEQEFDPSNIPAAVRWLLNNSPKIETKEVKDEALSSNA